MPVLENKTETLPNENQDQFSAALSYVKNKMKNLNIRKKNLEVLKNKVDAGRQGDLQVEQIQAVTKLPEVEAQLQQLDKVLERLQRGRELHTRHEKQLRQQLKQQQLEREQVKLQRVLLVQDVLSRLDECVCTALLEQNSDSDSSSQLSGLVLEQLQQMAALITPSRANNDTPFQEQLVSASEHLIRLTDASQKKVVGTTYTALSRAIDLIVDSGVLDGGEGVQRKGQQQHHEDEAEEEVVTGHEVIDGNTMEADSPLGADHVASHEAEVFPSENGHIPVENTADPVAVVADELLADTEVHPSSSFCEPAPQSEPVPSDAVQPSQPDVLSASHPSIQFLQDSELTVADPAQMDPAVVCCSTNPAQPPTSASLPPVDTSDNIHVPQSPPAASAAAVISSQTFTNSSLANEPCEPTVAPSVGVSVTQSTSWADEADWADQPAAVERNAWSKPQPGYHHQQEEEETDSSPASVPAASEWINSTRNSDNGRRGGSRYRGAARGRAHPESGHNGFHSGAQSGGFASASTGGGHRGGGRPYRGGGYGGRRGNGGPTGGYRRGGGERGGGGYRGGAARGSRGTAQ